MATPNTSQMRKRLVASSVTAAMLLQTVSPVFASVMQVPGIYFVPPDPNVMFTLDDSGSMTSDAIPDMLNDPNTTANEVAGMPTNTVSNALDQANATFPGMWKLGSNYLTTTYYRSDNAIARYLRSSAGNPLYYDPKVTYKPWPDPANDQNPYPYGTNGNADPTRVNIHTSDPFNITRRVDLTARVNESGGTGAAEDQTRNFWPATWYVYTGTTPMQLARPNNTLNVATSFQKYEIKTLALTPSFPRAATRTDCSGAVGTTGCTRAEELQNFANWLQYYRNRMLMAKGGVAAAFAQQGTNLRVGFHTINSGATMRQAVVPFAGANRTAFYTDLYGRPTNGSTPLREAMDYVGKYFLGNTTRGNPWTDTATARPTDTDRCRKSYHILSTDGFWNGNPATGAAANNANDEFTGSTPPLPTGGTYPYTDTAADGTMAARFSVSPYGDNVAQVETTLAAVAAYYWRTDLQNSPTLGSANLGNYVTPSSRDPAHWQHLTTFTVGLGVSGTGQVRPRDTSLSTTNANGEYVVAASVATRPDYAFLTPYIGKTWLSEDSLRNLLMTKRVALNWTIVRPDQPTTGDDLIHAAMNGRGRYFSATNPTDLATGISSALAEATNQDRSFASLGLANTNETSTSNRLYQAIYNPFGWRGRLYSFAVSNGTFSTAAGTQLWEASQAMPAPAVRNIFTWNAEGTTPQGTTFTWAGLNATQRTALGNNATERAEVLDWLRGSEAREASQGGSLRDRPRDTATAGVLGDIVGGSPLRGPTAGGGYGRLSTATAATATARSTYASFRSADSAAANSPIANMTKTLFFGANDGMLHALNAVDDPADYAYNAATMGRERFAYVPNSVFSVPRTFYNGTTATVRKLYELSQPDYGHLFTVNAPPQIADAYIRPTVGNETGWKSVLLAATGAGSRGVFALDVTNPDVGAAATQFNASKVLWEFSEAQNADMGHVVSWPNVGLMRDGTWAAIFGNGYDSSTGRAKLFVVNLDTGAVIWEQAVGATGGNGLSQPNFLLNNNREVIAIWAGDLLGNMWKFDVSSALRSDWRVAYNGNPLFTTPANQPITTMPEIEQFPGTDTAMLVFGTGKFFDTQDIDPRATDTSGNVVNKNLAARQAIYGIWDNGVATVTGLTQLVEQTIGAGVNGFLRTSENTVDYGTRRGWYIRLNESTATPARPGERVNVNPIIPVKGRNVPVFVIANTPSLTPCEGSGSARIFALDPITGQTPRFSVFDADRLNGINSADGRSNVMVVAAGLLSSPRFLSPVYSGGVVEEKPGTRGQTGGLEGGVEFNSNSGNAGCSSASNGRLIAGVSDTTTVNERVKLGECTPRISWRQVK